MKYINNIYTPDMSGKQGSVIFSSNQYGAYTCQRKIPIDNKTVYQQDVRASTTDIGHAWIELSPSQREQWNKQALKYPFVKKGKVYFITGYLFFMKLNRFLHSINQPVINDFPTGVIIKPQAISSFSVKMIDTLSGKDLILYISPATTANNKITLSATSPLAVTEGYGSNKPTKIGVLDSSFSSGSSINQYYLDKYQKLPGLKTKIFVSVKSTNINSGFTSPLHSCEVYGI